jgi:hypothetical protein
MVIRLVQFALIATLAALLAEAQTVRADKKDVVRLSYELVLTRCRGASCHADPVAKGEVSIQLEDEDRNFAWGNESVEEHAGNVTYYLRFKASRRSKGNGVERALDIGFSGRVETPSRNEQVTWADKLFTNTWWKAFPAVSILGRTYPDGEETISPTLHVKTLLKNSGL